jgi:hypothetical protein
MYAILKVIFIKGLSGFHMNGAFLLVSPREISIPDDRHYAVTMPERRAREILNKVCEEYGYELASAVHESGEEWKDFYFYLKKI